MYKRIHEFVTDYSIAAMKLLYNVYNILLVYVYTLPGQKCETVFPLIYEF